jgi:hypothetical protein
MKAYGGEEVQSYPFLTSVLGGGELSASCPNRLASPLPARPLNRRLGGPRSWSDCFGVQKNLLLLRGIEARSLVVQPIAQLLYRLHHPGLKGNVLLLLLLLFVVTFMQGFNTY